MCSTPKMPVPNPVACPYCRAKRFAFIDRARIELVSNAKVGSGNVLTPELSLLVCLGCGHTGWFLRDHGEQLEQVIFEERRAPDESYR